MSLLPLSRTAPGSDDGHMNVVRRIGQIIAECNEAQRRLTYRRLSYDQYLPEPDAPPETFAEFMLRTSGPLRREPSARHRLAGRAVR